MADSHYLSLFLLYNYIPLSLAFPVFYILVIFYHGQRNSLCHITFYFICSAHSNMVRFLLNKNLVSCNVFDLHPSTHSTHFSL